MGIIFVSCCICGPVGYTDYDMIKNNLIPMRGISVVETLATLAVTGILASWAFPAYQNSVSNKQLNTVRNELITVLNTGRSEAVLKRTHVTVCPRAGRGSMTCGTAQQWGEGWLLFLDEDNDRALNPSGSDLLLATEPIAAGVELHFPIDAVTFNRHGFAQGAAGTFVFCDRRRDEFLRGLILANMGSVRMAEDSSKDSDFIPEGGDGTNLTCGFF